MKITSVEAIELRLPEEQIADKASAGQNCLVVKIHTDEGLVGVGEIDSHARVAKAAVDGPFVHSVCTGLARVMLGLDPLDIRVINEKLYQSTFYYGRRGVVVQAIGGLDIALWDLKGKALGQPIHRLLGGAFHDRQTRGADSGSVEPTGPAGRGTRPAPWRRPRARPGPGDDGRGGSPPPGSPGCVRPCPPPSLEAGSASALP